MKKKPANRINPFKLFYYRKAAGLTQTELAEMTGIAASKLAELEDGVGPKTGKLPNPDDFAKLDNVSRRKIEAALNCPSLQTGKDDDFRTQLVHFYEANKPQERTLTVLPQDDANGLVMTIAAIVFDFDGTLTRSTGDRTTWERLWMALGYEKNECGLLAHRYFNKEIDHEEWCRLTLEKFKARRLTRDTVLSVGSSIVLVDGFEDTIKRIHEHGIPMYIVSGSIFDVVISALGEFERYFKRIEANAFSYTPANVIANITGTHYDFDGKGEFIKKIANTLNVRCSQILFVGNSINDEKVKSISGAKTMLVNPHLSGPSQNWDIYVPHMDNLTEILPYIGIADSSSQDQGSTNRVDEIISLLEGEDAIDLDNYTVIGGYRRFDAATRAQLRALSQQIIKALSEKPLGRENYLICAAPGSGKTFFVEEVARSLGNKTSFVSIDLSKDSRERIESQLNLVGTGDSSCLCLIDEIDGRAGEWCYDVIYKKLDVNENAQATTVFTLIGSSGGNINGLKKAIESRPKAKDLIDRISDQSNYSIQIPPLGIGDSVCVYVSKVRETSAKLNAGITHVQKMAVFHAAMTAATKSPRQIKMLVDQAVNRAKFDGTVLKYDHHFVPGDSENKNFWNKYPKAVLSLPGDIKIALN